MEFVRDRAMAPFVKGGQFFDGGEANFQEKIGELEKVWEKANKPAHPDMPVKRTSDLKEKIDDKNRKGKIGKKFLQKSGLFTFGFFGESLANIPVGDTIFQKMRGENQGDTKKRIGYFGSDKGAGGSVGNGKHVFLVYYSEWTKRS